MDKTKRNETENSQIWILVEYSIDFIYNLLTNIVALVFHDVSRYKFPSKRSKTLVVPTVDHSQNENENLNSILFK